jgi:hypothetical protein
VQELRRQEKQMLWAGYSLWQEHINPETAESGEHGSYDDQGRYRGTGRASNAAKADRDFYAKFEQYKTDVNGTGAGASA